MAELTASHRTAIFTEPGGCCNQFKAHACKNGLEGLPTVLIRTSGETEGYIDFRSSATPSGRFEAGTKMKFCPWCGKRISKL